MRSVLLAALLSWTALLPFTASAHEMSLAEMELREVQPGDFLWHWSATNDKRAGVVDLHPQWPSNCVADEGSLHCGDKGLTGELRIDGVGKAYSAAMVKVFWIDGQSRVYTITGAQPVVHLYGSSEDRRGSAEIASAYVVLGVEHILTGYDHLCFVLALLFLVGFRRQLIYTITAFTLSHTLTLALSALGWLSLRSPPVEATIALSIMLVAAEALHDRPTLARRWPALVAFLFGLVHGLGFAGALREIGLPQNHLAVALLTFNVGVEVGQLMVVTLAYALYRSFAARSSLAWARVAALYGIGSIAAFWSIERVVGILA